MARLTWALMPGIAVLGMVASASGQNYLMNPSGDDHWTHPSFTLEYTGAGTSATYLVDGASDRFQTRVDTVLDVDVDLTDFTSFKTLGQLVTYLDGLADYSAVFLPLGGQTNDISRDPDAIASCVTDLNTGGNELVGGYDVQVGWTSNWAWYSTPDPYANVFGRGGTDTDRGISVRDVQTADSPNIKQEVHVQNPDWEQLKGKAVVMRGWCQRFETSGTHDGQVRLHHGVGGATINDHTFWAGPGAGWQYYESSPFTVDPNSDTAIYVLFWGTIAQVYAGTGWVIYDDVELIPAPWVLNGTGNVNWNYSSFKLEYTGAGSSAYYWVDEENDRFQTYVDGVLDVDVDLTDFTSFKKTGQLVDYLEALPDYTAAFYTAGGTTAAISQNYHGLASTLTHHGAFDSQVGGNNLKNPGVGYPVQVAWANSWALYGPTATSASMFGRSGAQGDRAISVYDDRPSDPYPESPESVTVSQNLHETHPYWESLKGMDVKIKGWARRIETSGSTNAQIRVHHGVDGATINDFLVDLPVGGAWQSFETAEFTIAADSNQIRLVLFPIEIGQIYWGSGWVLFDDIELEVTSIPAANLVSSDPANDGVLPAEQNNCIELLFDGDASAVTVSIKAHLGGGSFGPDLSGSFTKTLHTTTLLNDTMRLQENGDVLSDGTWYRIEPTAGSNPFTVDLLVLYGDADQSGTVADADYVAVKAWIGNSDTCKHQDLNGSGRVTAGDYLVVKNNKGDGPIPKP